MKTVPVIWDDATIEEAAAGRLTIYRDDEQLPYQLTAKDREAYERAKKVGFIIQARRPNAVCCYAAYCKVHNRPLVKLHRKIKYGAIHCDMIVCDWDLDGDAMRKIERLGGGTTPVRLSRAGGRFDYVLLDRIPLDQAETIAFRLFEYAMDCRPFIA